MIQSLTIKNRQSWADGHFDLHPNVNLLVGSGDSGKSAILRALFWPIYNTAGDSQVSNWAKKIGAKSGKVALTDESSVTVTKPNGTLTRFRNPSENGYTVNGETLKAVGDTVPDEVQSFFNMGSVNVMRQHPQTKAGLEMEGPYFVFGQTGGAVATYLNQVVNLDEISLYLKAAAGCLKDAKENLGKLEKDQTQDAKALEALAWVEGIQSRIDALDALHKELQAARDKHADLLHWINTVKASSLDLLKAQGVTALEPKLQEVRKLQQASQGVGTRLKAVKGLRESWAACTLELERVGRLAALHPRVKAVRELAGELEAASAKCAAVQMVHVRWVSVATELAKVSKVAKLQDLVEAVKARLNVHKEQEGRLEALRALRVKWLDASKAMKGEGVLDGLEAKAKRTRKLWEKSIEVSKRLADLRRWGLTIQGVQATLVKSRAEVVELTAKRPETCPYCGSGNHKGEGC